MIFALINSLQAQSIFQKFDAEIFQKEQNLIKFSFSKN